MIVYGYVNDHKYAADGTLQIQVRIPNVHGPWKKSEYKGNHVRNYINDDRLPWYNSVLLHHLPVAGEVVAMQSINDKATDFLIIGLTGGSYYNNTTL